MAAIDKRGSTVRIRVFVGTDTNGKKIMKSTTFTPPTDTTSKRAERLAQEFAFEFERQYLNLNVNVKDISVSMKI